MSIPIIVISLPNAKYRRDNIEVQSRVWGLRMTILDATDGRILDLNELVKLKILNGNAVKHAQMHQGDLGCYLSHYRALEAIEKTGQPIGMIMEDDFKIMDEWKNLSEYLKNIPKDIDWDFIYLGYNTPYGKQLNNWWILGQNTNLMGLNSGAWAYLVNASSIPKLKKLFIPINKHCERDVLVRNLIGKKITALFTTKKLVAHEPVFGSNRKELNIKKPLNYYNKLF